MVDQDVMKKSTKKEDDKEQESRFGKVKRMITDSLRKSHNSTPSSFEEAKSICKARKRKERQESISSVSQERKVIRSNSEERPVEMVNDSGKKDIRRVVSHEDFQKTHPLHERNDTIVISLVESNGKYSPPKSTTLDGLAYDDCEHERRRYHERFAQPLAPRGRRINAGRKYKNKHVSKNRLKEDYLSKENGGVCTNNNNEIKSKTYDQCTAFEVHHKTDNVQSNSNPPKQDTESTSSPIHTPIASTLDLSTLHQQIDSSEPIRSSSSQELTDQTETLPSLLVASNRLLSSPRNSIMITHRIYLDPNVQQSKASLGKDPKTPLEKKFKQLSKQINAVKRKIKKYDEEFQQTFGYKSSQADKMNDKNVRKLCSELSKLKREYKQLKGDSSVASYTSDPDNTCESKHELLIQDTLSEIEKRLTEKRIISERGLDIDDMTNEQIIDEKVAVQKALLYLESLHGRPSTKEDRNLVRPLYDRYRTLKRMMAKISLGGGVVNELATIHEHETMDFVSSTPQTSEAETEKLYPSGSTDSDTDISLGESFHTLSLNELLQQQQDMIEEKKQLRRSLKEFENELQNKTGRKLQKDDKIMMSTVYNSYKRTKAKLRLLDALIVKQKP